MEGGGLSWNTLVSKYMYIFMLIIGWMRQTPLLVHSDSHVTIDALVMGNKYTVSMCEQLIGWSLSDSSAMHDQKYDQQLEILCQPIKRKTQGYIYTVGYVLESWIN
jgi:hypothetical protein